MLAGLHQNLDREKTQAVMEGKVGARHRLKQAPAAVEPAPLRTVKKRQERTSNLRVRVCLFVFVCVYVV